MNKVIIIGCPGSGKSYFSKKLSKINRLLIPIVAIVFIVFIAFL